MNFSDDNRRGPCEECGGGGVERLFGGRFLCDDCCEALATEDERSVIIIEWTETDGETYVVRMPAAIAHESIGFRGLRAMGYDQEAMEDDPFGEFWDAVDRNAVARFAIGVPPNDSGRLVGTAFDIMLALE